MIVNSNKNNKIKSYNNEEPMVSSISTLPDITRKDIEKSYNIDNINGTEAYYSNRYGWILRKTVI